MSLLLISDLHFSNRTAFAHPISDTEFPGTNSRFKYIAEAFRASIATAVAADCEAVVICGDIFHERGSIHIPVYNAVYRLFEEAIRKVKLIVYPGNHDMVDLKALHAQDGLHSLMVLKDKLQVIDKPSIVSLSDYDLCIVPFNYKVDETVAATNMLLEQLKTRNYKRIYIPTIGLFHHSFSGAKSGPWEWQMPETLQVSDVAKFDLNFSGHFHMHQTIEKLTYVGSLLQHDQGERHYTPGAVLIKEEGQWEHTPNCISPKFELIDTANIRSLDFSNCGKEDYLTVRWSGSPSKVKDIKFEFPYAKIEVKTEVKEQQKRTEIKTDTSVPDMFKQYIAYKGKDETAYFDMGMALYEGRV